MKDTRELLEQLERSLLEPTSRSDPALLDKLIAADFIEVAAGGRSYGKDEVCSRLPSETDVSFQCENLAVRLLSPTVGLVIYSVTRNADGLAAHSKRSSIWRLDQDQWRIVYHQGTAT